MELSERLRTVAGCVTKGLRVADIGCDHGYTAIYLVSEKISPHVYAMDINRGPLGRARENIAEAGLQQEITVRLSGGLEKLYPNEAECILISGMGGLLMKEILSGKPQVLQSAKELVLQPQSEYSALRHFLHDEGFSIVYETMVYDMGKYYTVIKAEPGMECYGSEMEYEYGRLLIMQPSEVFLSYLRREKMRIESIVEPLQDKEGERVRERRRELRRKLIWIDEMMQLQGNMDTKEKPK